MSDAPRVVYRPREDATPQSEAAALASVYGYIIDCAKKAAAHATSNGPDDAKGFEDEKEKGGRHVERLTSSPSGVED